MSWYSGEAIEAGVRETPKNVLRETFHSESLETFHQRCSCQKQSWEYAAFFEENIHVEVWFQ